MDNQDSFLNIEDLTEANKDKLLLMRQTLFASVVRNAQKEDKKGMYIIALAVFSEFDRLTRHILESDIIKN